MEARSHPVIRRQQWVCTAVRKAPFTGLTQAHPPADPLLHLGGEGGRITRSQGHQISVPISPDFGPSKLSCFLPPGWAKYQSSSAPPCNSSAVPSSWTVAAVRKNAPFSPPAAPPVRWATFCEYVA